MTITALTRDDLREANLDPTDFEYLSSFDLSEPNFVIGFDPVTGTKFMTDTPTEKGRMMPLLKERGVAGGNFATKKTCDHCGAYFRYVVVFEHRHTGTLVAVGQDCADNRFDLPSKAAFDVMRLQKKAKAARTRKFREEAREKFLSNPERKALIEFIASETHPFLQDLHRNFLREGTLTEAQEAAARKFQENARKWAEEREQQPKSTSEHVGEIGERLELELTVKAARGVESFYGYSTLYVMEDEDGNVFKSFYSGSSFKLEKGETYRIRGTVKRHDVFNGTKQTELNRLALVGELETA